jgi:signal transduction histidine kinase
VRQALDQGGASKAAGFTRFTDRTLMIMVAPVCRQASPCNPVGFAIVGIDAARVVQQVAKAKKDTVSVSEDVTLFDQGGHALTSTAKDVPPPAQLSNATEIEQRRMRLGDREVASAYTGFSLAGQPAGTIAVTIPATTTVSSVGPAALRLVGLVILAMVAAVAVGAVVSRLILRQLRTLVETSRKLGEGKLFVRAPVMSGDEHGELAAALNRMAEQLQVSHETLELKVEQRTEEIRRLMQDRTEFFAGLSHELRTPLAIILTQADMLLTTGGHRSSQGQASETIRASASQLLDIVNDILDLAQAEAGSIEVNLEPVRLHDFFPDVKPMLVRLGAACEIDLKIVLPASLPAVTADPARLREVLLNLVDNAVKYTPSGGDVEISAVEDADDVRISIADTGVGIPPEVGDRVFEPFYRVAGTAPQRGEAATGLGLALARRWVEAQGGTISWAPNRDGGTVFDFTLQADRTRPASAPRRSAASRDGHRSQAPPRRNGGRLLRRKSDSGRK